jgi:hypothetical protein
MMMPMAGPGDAQRHDPPGLIEASGGPLGTAETTIPGVAYVAVYPFAGTTPAAVVAVAIAAVLATARLARRETPRHALSGLIGVAFGAWIATHTGKAENFYLPGLLFNIAYGSAFLVSIALRRPLVGYIVGQLDGEGTAWRDDPERVAVFTRASWLWAGLFAVRLAVQLPLYLAGAVVALGIARTALGLPLFALGLWITYKLVRPPVSDDED